MSTQVDGPEAVLRGCGLVREFAEASGRLSVLSGVDLAVHAGEQVAIIGPSGSGKTALLNLLGGLDKPDAGWVSLCGQKLGDLPDRQLARLRGRQIGFVYQFSHLLGQFSALDNIAMPLYLDGQPPALARQRAGELLEAVGLSDRAGTAALDLSGGERQRVAVARAFATRPACLLMDEPTGNLDAANTARVQLLIQELVTQARSAVVLATHDTALAEGMDRMLRLEKGRLIES